MKIERIVVKYRYITVKLAVVPAIVLSYVVYILSRINSLLVVCRLGKLKMCTVPGI